MSFDFTSDIRNQLPTDNAVEFNTGIHNKKGEEHVLFVKYADDNVNPQLRKLALAKQSKFSQIARKKKKTEADLASLEKENIQIYAKSVITGWKGVQAKGKNVEFNYENCVQYLTDMKNAGVVWDDLTDFCTAKDNFVLDNLEEAVAQEEVEEAVKN